MNEYQILLSVNDRSELCDMKTLHLKKATPVVSLNKGQFEQLEIVSCIYSQEFQQLLKRMIMNFSKG